MRSFAQGVRDGFTCFRYNNTVTNTPTQYGHGYIIKYGVNIRIVVFAMQLDETYTSYSYDSGTSWTNWDSYASSSNFKRYSFNGTPDSDGVIITDCPLSTHIPIAAYQLNREGWIINFVQNNNKSTSYWCARITGANASSGNFSAYVAAITRSLLTT